ncbi:MAG TPA: dTDP-glucose 4,6-dehydratase [Chloroflexi bacterium]|jgi:dTDP-glucose 4,6-dehydratase|nr:dTDP-glucose 4,6-dehydratase [Anaerolineaceae bacterium]HHX08686.1 dTDP-glucose 4,6-dehydratase [Chloroflexota bacterium]
MKQVLVTGGAGFIGSNFIHWLLKQNPDVHIVNLDALTYAGSLENLKDLPDPSRHTFLKGSITDRALVDSIFSEHKIDTVIHFAAESHVDRSILNPGIFVDTNVVGTFTLLEAARRSWLVEKNVPVEQARFHHVSTDEVFGTLTPEEPPFEEDTSYSPRSPYAASKASSDHFVRAYHITYGLPVTISNCSNNYGPRQFPEKLIPLMVLNALNGRALPVYGDGMQIRDWLYVDDHCEAIWKVATQGRVGETYCVGGDNQPPNIEIVKTICSILDELQPNSEFTPHEQLIKYVQDRPGHDRRYDINIDKIQQELGWQPRHDLAQGLLDTVKWYMDNPEWVEEIVKQSDYNTWVKQNYTERKA